MLRTSISVLSLVALLGGLVAAQDKTKETKKPAGKELVGKVTKVDVAKKTISVATEDGKKLDILTGDDTKFIGPRGGKGEGLKDDRLDPGYEIRVVMDAAGKLAAEVHLPYRKNEKKADDKKPDDKKKADDKKPAEKKPEAKKPAEKKPEDKKPTEKKPEEKKPAEKKPADKKDGK